MTAVIHYGKDSDRYLKQFAEKRAETAIQDIRSWSAKELMILLNAIHNTEPDIVPAA